MTTPHTLQVLIDTINVHEGKEDAAELYGEVDGLGFYRSIKVTKKAGTWIGKALDVIEDERIESIRNVKDGTIITVVADHRADSASPFLLTEVDSILSEE